MQDKDGLRNLFVVVPWCDAHRLLHILEIAGDQQRYT